MFLKSGLRAISELSSHKQKSYLECILARNLSSITQKLSEQFLPLCPWDMNIKAWYLIWIIQVSRGQSVTIFALFRNKYTPAYSCSNENKAVSYCLFALLFVLSESDKSLRCEIRNSSLTLLFHMNGLLLSGKSCWPDVHIPPQRLFYLFVRFFLRWARQNKLFLCT